MTIHPTTTMTVNNTSMSQSPNDTQTPKSKIPTHSTFGIADVVLKRTHLAAIRSSGSADERDARSNRLDSVG